MSYLFYKEYKHTSVGWLGKTPVHWELKRLSYFFDERRQKVSDKEFQPLSVTKNGIVPQLENAAKTDDGDNRKLALVGDFVINSRSDRKGSSGLSKLNGSVSLINIVITPKKNIYGNFVHYLFRSIPFQEEYYRYGKGIVADLWSTNYSEMKNILLALPTYDEQQQIANFLDTKTAQIDLLTEKIRKTIEILKEKRVALINQCVTKGLDPSVPMKDSGIEWLGQVPKHWEVVRLKYVGVWGKGSGLSKSDIIETGIPVILYGDIYTLYDIKTSKVTKYISKDKSLSTVKISKGTIVLTASGETKEAIAKACVYIGNEEICVGGDTILFKPTHSNYIYLSYLFNSYLFSKNKMELAKGEIIVHISKNNLTNIKIPLPPLPEQQAIATYLDTQSAKIDKLIQKQENLIELLNLRKSTLISSAVTGKIDVRNQSESER